MACIRVIYHPENNEHVLRNFINHELGILYFPWEIMLESRSDIITLISQVFCEGPAALRFRKSLLKAAAYSSETFHCLFRITSTHPCSSLCSILYSIVGYYCPDFALRLSVEMKNFCMKCFYWSFKCIEYVKFILSFQILTLSREFYHNTVS